LLFEGVAPFAARLAAGLPLPLDGMAPFAARLAAGPPLPFGSDLSRPRWLTPRPAPAWSACDGLAGFGFRARLAGGVRSPLDACAFAAAVSGAGRSSAGSGFAAVVSVVTSLAPIDVPTLALPPDLSLHCPLLSGR